MSLDKCAPIKRGNCNTVKDPNVKGALESIKNRLTKVEDYINGQLNKYANEDLPETILLRVASSYETKTSAAKAYASLFLDAHTYADSAVATFAVEVAATYETQTSASAAYASIISQAETYADSAVATFAATVETTYETQSAASAAYAAVLASAESYADGAVSTLAATVEATYETQTSATTARAALLLTAEAYTDGEVSSASAILSASINDVSAALSLYVTETAPGTYASIASLTAGTINFVAEDAVYFGLGGDSAAEIYFGTEQTTAYGGLISDPITGFMEVGFFAGMDIDTPSILFSPGVNGIFAYCDEFVNMGKTYLRDEAYKSDGTTDGVVQAALMFTGKTIATGDWTADATYSDFPYKADITCSGVTSAMSADVIFDPAAIVNYVLAPVTNTSTDKVTVYAAAIPAASITILQIKAVF